MKRAADLKARSEARRKQLESESREKATARRVREAKIRNAKRRKERAAKRAAKAAILAKQEKLAEAKRTVGAGHLVAQAHTFILGTEEAQNAIGLAKLGLLPSDDDSSDQSSDAGSPGGSAEEGLD